MIINVEFYSDLIEELIKLKYYKKENKIVDIRYKNFIVTKENITFINKQFSSNNFGISHSTGLNNIRIYKSND